MARRAQYVNAHNAGPNRSTAPWKPWFVDVIVEFRTERMAVRFEKYLKSGTGHAAASTVRMNLEWIRDSLAASTD